MFRNQRGQTIASVLLIMVLALSVGVAIATRFTSTLRQNIRQDSSSRALAVAEAAIERMLTKDYSALLDYITYGNCGSECVLEILGDDNVLARADVTLTHAGNSSAPFQINLARDSVTEVSLVGYSANTNVYVCWDIPSTGSLPSVFVNLIYGTDGNYQADSYAANSIGSVYASNGFDEANSALGYSNCLTVNSMTNPQALRIRSLYNEALAYVVPSGGSTIPSQGVLISSIGKVMDSERKVEVLLGSPAVPMPFDYVLYSKTEELPLSN